MTSEANANLLELVIDTSAQDSVSPKTSATSRDVLCEQRPDLSQNSPRSNDEPSDEMLMEQIKSGSTLALGVLFQRTAAAVRAVAMRILRDAAEADDLIQDVFLFIHGRATIFDSARGSVRSWIVQIAYHRAIDRRRYLIARRFYTNLGINEPTAEAQLFVEPMALEKSIEAVIGVEGLRDIQERLSVDQRRVIELYFYEGYTVEEISVAMGQTSGNIRNHYYRALEKMRRCIPVSKLRKK